MDKYIHIEPVNDSSNINYYEFVLKNPLQLKHTGLNKLKYSVKLSKVYVKDNLYLEADNDTKEVRVYKKEGLKQIDYKYYKVLAYEKHKLPIHLFPSTTNFHSIYYVRNTIYRLHSKVYINIEEQKFKENKEIIKIYINYNHNKALEIGEIQAKLERAFKLLNIDEQVAISEILSYKHISS